MLEASDKKQGTSLVHCPLCPFMFERLLSPKGEWKLGQDKLSKENTTISTLKVTQFKDFAKTLQDFF